MTEDVLDEPVWRALATQHAHRAEQWITPHLDRRRRGEKHPIMDFLFDYYPYSPGKIRTWHPGVGVALAGNWRPPSNSRAYLSTSGAWTVDPHRVERARLALAIRILEGTHNRPAQHSCFGMHEWAMVYRMDPGQVRHDQQPLRLAIDEINAAVEEVGLRCTHIDAYRFFTEDAVPLNTIEPTRATQPDLDQPGCVHANMDLFKYAMWFQPFIPGTLVLDCFELSVAAREIDMRASPYDVGNLGYRAIAIETAQGRREYALEQRLIADRARPLRSELLAVLKRVEAAATRVPST